MMNKQAQQEMLSLRERFFMEQEDVQKYVHFLQYKANIFYMDVVNLLQGLITLDLLPYETRQRLKKFVSWEDIPLKYDRLDNQYMFPLLGVETLQNIYDIIQPFKSQIEQILKGVADEISVQSIEEIQKECIERFDPEKAAEIIEALDVTTTFIMKDTRGNIKVQHLDNYREAFLKELHSLETAPSQSPILRIHEKFHDRLTREDMQQIIECGIEIALYRIKSAKLSFVFAIKEKIEQLDVALKISKQKENMNIFRQGFINLLTIFDAIMFDIVRTVLMHNFFKLIEEFHKSGKELKELTVSIKGLKKYRSSEDFQKKIIEAQLKTCYLRDILYSLDKLKAFYSATKEKYDFGHLIEIVMRRNVHLHNGGIVDEQYLNEKTTGIYGLQQGDLAEITPEYWNRANQLCKECVERIIEWGLAFQ